jgi:hypothetical protein
MNIFEKFLNSIAYKFPKGYPDMSNEQDISLLESLVNEVLGENVNLNESSVKQNTIKAINAILNSKWGKKYNFKTQTEWKRLGNLDKISSEQFLEIIKDVFKNPSVKMYKPKEGSNPSSKFNMFEFNTPDGLVQIILSGGANIGEKYEQDFVGRLKSNTGVDINDIEDNDVKKLYQTIGIDPSTLKPEDINFAGSTDTKRSLSFEGPQNIGEKIADIIIKPDYYISLKNISGGTFYNGGTIPFIVEKEGKAVYEPSKFDSKPMMAAIFKAFQIDPKKVAQGINEYITGEGKIPNSFISMPGDTNALKNLIASGYGYGYWYVREKKNDIFIYNINTAKDAYNLVGDIKDISIKYPNTETKTLTLKLVADSPILGQVNYLIEIRNAQGKLLPLDLKMKTT